MLVYRVVDQNGDGMYRPSSMDGDDALWSICCDDYDDDHHHPSPCMINRKICVKFLNTHYHPTDFFFGFSSKEQLNHWVFKDEWKERIHLAGGKILVFDVPPKYCVCDDYQVAFLKERAIIKEEISILEF